MPLNSDLNPQLLVQAGSLISGQLLMVAEGHAESFLSAVAASVAIQDRALAQQDHLAAVAMNYSGGRAPSAEKPFVFADGLAVIPVHGALLNRNAYASSSATGYNFIRSQLNAAMADPDVEHIVYDFATTGGHAAGCFEMTQEIAEASKIKPAIALVDPYALSAGCSLASGVSHIALRPSAYFGSIGVLNTHINIAGALEKFGVSMELLYEGARKVDGNPFGPLSDEARAGMRSRLTALYSRFVGVVAQNRAISEDSVRATQAEVYTADEAKRLGLIDSIGSPADAVAEFRENQASLKRNRGTITMSNPNAEPVQPKADAPTQPPAAPAQQPEPQQSAPDAGAQERARIQGILNCDEAKNNPGLANHFAFSTSASVDEAVAALKASSAAAPEQTPAAQNDPLGALMGASGGGANVPATVVPEEQEKPKAGADAILAAMGRTPKA